VFHSEETVSNIRAHYETQVVYGERGGEAPDDRIRERSFKSDDINDNMGGKCVPDIPYLS
jgi:hypothetical protein